MLIYISMVNSNTKIYTSSFYWDSVSFYGLVFIVHQQLNKGNICHDFGN